jgi:hypothetical protein
MDLFKLVRLATGFWSAVKAKDWATAFETFGELSKMVADMLRGAVTAAAWSQDPAEWKKVEDCCAEMRAFCETPPATAADPAGVTPGDIVLLVQTFLAVVEWIRKRRQG